ncbi:hypothetical protein D3C85_1820940 [compost metagenome]
MGNRNSVAAPSINFPKSAPALPRLSRSKLTTSLCCASPLLISTRSNFPDSRSLFSTYRCDSSV